jgi:hypothetical protein
MEVLGYTHMAVMYEETVGPLRIRSIALPRKLSLKQVGGAIALAGFLIFGGGVTAMVASTLSRSNVTPVHQEVPGF